MDSLRTLKLTFLVAISLVGAKFLLVHAGREIPLSLSVPLISVVVLIGLAASLMGVARQRRKRAPIEELADAAEEAWRHARRGVILVVGLTVLAASIPIGALPGPGGIAVAIAGLAILATEFMWAKWLLTHTKLRAERAAREADRRIKANPRPWLIPIVGAAIAGVLYAAMRVFPEVSPRTILTVSAGPVLMWVFWSYMTLVAWIRARNGVRAGAESRAGTGRNAEGG